MLKLNTKWRKTAQSLHQKSFSKPNARLRERLLALHFVASDEPTDKIIGENFKIGNLTSFSFLSHRIPDYLMTLAFKKV